MSKLHRMAAFVLLICALCAVLCACKDGSTDNQSGSVSDSDLTGEIVRGGEITVGISQDLEESLDPHRAVAAGTKEVLFNVFEGLVKVTPDAELVPAVAESYSLSEDGTVYTFTLRSGVRFHNGDEVSAEDVVYSILRCADSSEGAPLVSAFSVIRSVEALDEKTVAITISEPNNEFLSYLTCAILPADYSDQATRPVGTGPFRYVSRSVQDNIVLERFDDYWGEKAYLDRVTYKIIENADALVLALKGGSIQLCAHLTAMQVRELSGSFRILEGTMNLVQALYLNNTCPPLDDPLVRQALCYAIDRQEIMDLTADGRGSAVGSSMYPAFKKYFADDLIGRYSRDTEKARQLLAQAGYADGFDLTITVPSNYQPHMDTAQVLVEQLRAVGVNAKVEPVEWGTWLESVYTDHNYQSTVVGVDASSMTARAMLERFTTGHSGNFINYASDEYDALFVRAVSAADEAEQVQLYRQMQAVLADTAANVYIQDLCDLVAIAPDLAGYVFYPIYVMDMSTVHYVQ